MARYLNMPIYCLDKNFFSGQDFAKHLHHWCMISGIRDFPDEFLTTLLEDFLVNEYGSLTLEEITLALRMNTLNQFDECIEAYNSLSIKFVTSVINKYQKHRIAAEKKLTALLEEENKPKPFVFSPFHSDYLVCMGVENMLYTFKRQEEILHGLSIAYDMLVKLGMYRHVEQIFDAAVQTAEIEYKRSVENSYDKDYKNYHQRRIDDGTYWEIVNTRAKETLVKEIFEKADEEIFVTNMAEKLRIFHNMELHQVFEEINKLPERYKL